MSYDPLYEASKALPVEHIVKQLEDFTAAGQDLARRRFSRSPPSVPSVPSTEHEESEPPSPGEQLRDKEINELQNSTADAQFKIQIRHELDRIRVARDKGLLQQRSLFYWEEAAEANVKYRWMQQGIWDERWASQPLKVWKHELQESQPPVSSSKSVKEGGVRKSRTKRKRQDSDLEEEYGEIIRCAVDFQNRQSSRPCYQFLYQLCKEREWIKMGLSMEDQDQNANLDSRAYKNLKSRWIRDGVWDDDWTSIPGTSWRHERPRKFPSPYEEFRKVDARKAVRMEQAERPPRWYFMAPVEPVRITNRFLSPPVLLEAAPDLSSPSVLKAAPQITSSPQDRSTTSQVPKETIFPASARKSTIKAKLNAKSQEQDERQIRSAAKQPTVATVKPTRAKSKGPEGKTPQKQRFKTTQPCDAEPRPVSKQSAATREKNRPSIPTTKTKGMTAGDTAPRPRRAAASKAIQHLTEATRRGSGTAVLLPTT